MVFKAGQICRLRKTLNFVVVRVMLAAIVTPFFSTKQNIAFKAFDESISQFVAIVMIKLAVLHLPVK